jgi:hypothetical protein
LAGRCALAVLDDELLHVLASRHARRARQTGALAMLPAALSFKASVLTLTGELSRASELAAEAAEMSEVAGAVRPRDGEIMLAAWRGDRATTAHLVDVMLGDVAYPDDGCEVAVAQYATAVLHNGLGNHAEAQAAAAGRAGPMSWASPASACRNSWRRPCVLVGQPSQRTPPGSSRNVRGRATPRGRSASRPVHAP